MAEQRGLKWWLKAVTPPIVVIAIKGALRRVGLLGPAPRPEGEPEDTAPTMVEPPEFEYVPEGWSRRVGGWDGGRVAEAYVAKWPEWVAALEGPVPLGVYHEARAGQRLEREDMAAHNMLVSFAYVLARAARGRERVSVLDWGGGLGHYAVLAGAVLPEVELDWHCREVPSVARAGAETNPGVTFHTDDACLERTYDLVLASSSLHYEQDWSRLLGRLGAAAGGGHLLVTRVPRYDAATALAVLILAAMLPLVFAQQWLTRGRRFTTVTGQFQNQPHKLGPWRWPALAAVLVVVAIVLGAPVVFALLGTFMKLFGFFNVPEPWTLDNWRTVLGDDLFLRSLQNSAWVRAWLSEEALSPEDALARADRWLGSSVLATAAELSRGGLCLGQGSGAEVLDAEPDLGIRLGGHADRSGRMARTRLARTARTWWMERRGAGRLCRARAVQRAWLVRTAHAAARRRHLAHARQRIRILGGTRRWLLSQGLGRAWFQSCRGLSRSAAAADSSFRGRTSSSSNTSSRGCSARATSAPARRSTAAWPCSSFSKR